MENNQNDDESPITRLPVEIILIIMSYNEIPDWINFSCTCKRFRHTIINNNLIWKRKFAQKLGEEFQKKLIKHKGDINWLDEHKHIYELKKCVISELVLFSPMFFSKGIDEYLWQNFGSVFKIATKSESSFYYTVKILQENIRKTDVVVDTNSSTPVHSLTTLYYARIVLSHLIQTYLCMKWVEREERKTLTPDVMTTFFVQWIDNANVYSDEIVEEKIQYLVEQVKGLLGRKKNYTDLQVVEKINEVIYRREQIVLTDEVTLETINVVEVLRNKCGSELAIGAIYQAVATRMGLECELCCVSQEWVFLEWVCRDKKQRRQFTIDLATGDLTRGRPSNEEYGNLSNVRYTPMGFLEHIIYAFWLPLTHCEGWLRRNFDTIREFVYKLSAYEIFTDNIKHALSRVPPSCHVPVDMNWLEKIYLKLLMGVTCSKPIIWNKDYSEVNERPADVPVKYAIGMVCYNTETLYACVIRNWSIEYVNDEVENTPIPFYTVVQEDGEQEIVRQDKIRSIHEPQRIQFIEDVLGLEFIHFNGYVYVPNEQKKLQYPHESDVINTFINNYFAKKN